MTTDPSAFSGAEAPEIHANAPGKDAIAYRYGTHATILQRLLSRLHQQEIPGSVTAPPIRPLQTLSIHDRDDPAIALLDGWATVADVLSFYQERIANEGYLRTAIEDRSILELSRAIGYKVRPGVAASTPLVFTIEDAPGSEPAVLVPQGTQVQSIPTQPGEQPQTFETVEDFEVRVEWNVLTPYLEQISDPSPLEAGSAELKLQDTNTLLKLQGTNTLLQPGDTTLILGQEKTANATIDSRYVGTLTSVKPNLQAGYTEIAWSEDIPTSLSNLQVFAFRQKAFLFGHNTSESIHTTIQGEGTITSTANSKDVTGTNTYFLKQLKVGDILIVGEQANEQVRIIETIRDNTFLTVKPAFDPALANGTKFSFIRRSNANSPPRFEVGQIDLDTVYAKLLAPSWIVLSQADSPNQTKLCHVNSTATIFRTDPVAGQITRLEVDSGIELSNFDVRKTSILLQSEKLNLFQKTKLKPQMEVIGSKTTIALDRAIPPLKPGQQVVISNSNQDGITNEVVTVENSSVINQRTSITFNKALEPDAYEAETLKIYANVVLATHGETIADEVLGSGDGTKTNQQFTLKKPPLTYVSTATATGIQSTLKVYVNQVLWQQVQSLHNQNARSQCYMVQTNEQGQTRIIFGDGIQGARLPSGQENVRATYRSGVGQVGEVKAGSLIVLQNRPLGIREVTNPLPASGAADRDSSDVVRKNAPRTVLTLDHVVSLRDFENFARSFAGIGKAQATQIWTGETRQIYITVADVDGQAASSALCNTLQDAIAAAGNALQPVQVSSPEECLFKLEAKILIGDRYRFEIVKPQIEQALRQAFSFNQREFSQGVAASEIIQIIQSVEGVIAVDLDALYIASQYSYDPAQPQKRPPLESFLVAQLARWDNKKATAKPAQILLLSPLEQKGIVLQEWT